MRSVSADAAVGVGEFNRSMQSASNRTTSSSRPLPLKQRTSSVDTRRDYSMQTVLSLIGLIKLREYFITVDNFSIWRRHLAWAFENGADLSAYMTQRFASSMVFMSLLLGAELNVLFNSAAVTTSMRRELFAENVFSIEFWAGITILVSVVLTILSLISTFTAWGMVSSIGQNNAHCILRSSIGQYAAELPGRFIVTAVYSFLLWVALFFFLLLPIGFWSLLLLIVTIGLFIHVVITFSAFGRIIMHTGAMGTRRIFDEATEKRLLPHSLHSSLLEKAKAELARNTSIMRQYRRKKTSDPETSAASNGLDTPTPEPRKRADSSVRFADTLWSSVPQREAALSDIVSAHDGTETPSSQVSVASSSLDARSTKRPPRPVVASGSSSFVDALGGSSHSLELDEWLRASSGPPAATKTEPSKNVIVKPTRRRSSSPATPLGGTAVVPPQREGRTSISPIDSDASGTGEETAGRAHWRPPSTVPMNRSMSAHSSIDGMGNNNIDRQLLTEEEKFDEEYGELFDEEMQRNSAEDSKGYEVEFGHEESSLHLSVHASEQQRLLPREGSHDSTYAAVDSVHNRDAKPSAEPRRRDRRK